MSMAALVAGLACGMAACNPAVESPADSATPRPDATPASEPLRRIEGVVQLEGRDLHSGIHVYLGGTAMDAWTGSQGRYVFEGVAPGLYELNAEKDGFAIGLRGIEVSEDSAVTMAPSITLEALAPQTQPATAPGSPSERLQAPPTPAPTAPVRGTRRIEGRVILTDAQGRLSNDFPAITVFVDELNLSSPLGYDGSFVLEELPARLVTVVARGTGYQLEAPALVDLSAIPQATVTLRMQRLAPAASTQPSTGAVTGFVTLPDDADDVSTIRVALAGTGISGITDAQGNFSFLRVPVDEYTVVAEADGFEAAQVSGVTVAAGEVVDVGELPLVRDIDPPKVVDTRPADGADDIEVRPSTLILLRFSKPMDRASVKNSLGISPRVALRAYMGNEHPQSSENVLVLELLGNVRTDALRLAQRYRLGINNTAMDLDGIPMEEPFEMRFATAGPAVVETYPEDGAVDVPVEPERSVRFLLNARLDPETNLERRIRVRPALEQEPRLEATYDPLTGWSEIRIFAMWEPDTRYRVTVDRGLETIAGVRYENLPMTLNFRTAPLVPIAPRRIQDIRELNTQQPRPIR